ncbi:MAG: phage tail sheath protein [Phormidesmis priestleyi]|uniref:Phage tail sheath protein n=1 Tax=Phormidesmis priestleyi TaxID=268141 RepID=A0A2W4WVR9_9CYAN|nr:MAG: phage tail sheath protein [Phormidesmis priestleyi]
MTGPITGLRFTTQSPPIKVDPNRSDVACFIGFIGRRRMNGQVNGQPTVVPSAIAQYLLQQGWQTGSYARSGAINEFDGESGSEPAQFSLLDVPVPIDSWAVFNQLFTPNQRPVAENSLRLGSTYLGTAVRAFFMQGGRRCYVVRMGDPLPMTADRDQRLASVATLIPGYQVDQPGTLAGNPNDRATWHGVGHLLGLSEISFLCLPDLSDAVADVPNPVETTRPVATFPERFVACSAPQASLAPDFGIRALPAPRCDQSGYQAWARAVNLIANFLEQHRSQAALRPVQLIAAVPLPQPETPAAADLLKFLESPAALFALARSPEDRSQAGIVSRLVQLAYPWVRSPNALTLPEQLESPDGLLIGLLARNALTQGTYRSAATLPLGSIVELVPALARSQIYQPSLQNKSLIERLSLFGPTPNGIQLLSDVTTSLDEAVRPASVHRLIGVILRAANRLGEALVFEASGEILWSRLQESLRGLMQSLFDAGAFRGRSPNEAFSVRCDRTTISQADIDNGRVIARIEFSPALPIERITVTLTLNDNSASALLPALITLREAA